MDGGVRSVVQGGFGGVGSGREAAPLAWLAGKEAQKRELDLGVSAKREAFKAAKAVPEPWGAA
eukprot:9457623-Alexandrium_andersonii.AAC.1